MIPSPRGRFRLLALDAGASDLAELRPPLERLLRAGVRVVVVCEDAARDALARDVRGPHRAGLVLVTGREAHALDGRPVAPRDGPLQEWVVRAIAEPRGISSDEVLVLDDDDALAASLTAQAMRYAVTMPGWIESSPEWHLVEEGFVVTREHEVESILALGNGYVGTRGSLAEGSPLSWPATFVAGVYEHEEGAVPELLKLPDWARLSGTVDGQQLRLDRGTIVSNRRVLDMRDGILWREWRHRDDAGRVTLVRGLRLASQADRHLLLQSVTLTPETYGGTVRVESMLSHPCVITTPEGVTVAFSIASFIETPKRFQRWTSDARNSTEAFDLSTDVARTYRLDRVLSVHTSRHSEDPARDARSHLDRVLDHADVEDLVAAHRRAWHDVWHDADVVIEGDAESQKAIRFAIYHMTSSVHPDDEAVSIGARGLTGASYKGHVFWDTEMFMLPFFVLTRPRAARSILMYRHRTLEAARARARRSGFAGALYAGASADTGDDVTPPYVMAPDGKLLPVLAGQEEHHISADVAWGVNSYWEATHDRPFLFDAGLEIMIETARFWASRIEEGDDHRSHIRRVMGPDEYHASVDDNAYTNAMARWNLTRAAELVTLADRRWPAEAQALASRLRLDARERDRWRDVARRMYLHVDEASGVIEQFRGYFELEPIDLSQYEPRNAPIDVLLGPERIERSQVIKQPDVVMLLHLLWDRFPLRVREANFRFYEPRCAHGSSLSPPIHAAVAARLGDTELAMRYLRQTAEIDLADNMGNSAGGVHMAALGGLWQAVVMGFAGLDVASGTPRIDPHLPPSWRALRFAIRWRGQRIDHALPVRREAEAGSEVGR